MSKDYLLGIDIGTSACKVAIFNKNGKVMASANGDYPVYYPHEGWAQQKPDEWWHAVCGAICECLETTWTIFLSAAGLPNLFKNVFVCSSVCFFVNFGISSIYAAASSYVNVSGSFLVNIIILIHPRFALIGCCAFLFYKLSVLICVLIRHPEYRITGTNLSNLNHITVF